MGSAVYVQLVRECDQNKSATSKRGWLVPSCGDVLRVWLLGASAAAGAKVGELEAGVDVVGVFDENVFWLQVTMEDVALVHVGNGAQ